MRAGSQRSSSTVPSARPEPVSWSASQVSATKWNWSPRTLIVSPVKRSRKSRIAERPQQRGAASRFDGRGRRRRGGGELARRHGRSLHADEDAASPSSSSTSMIGPTSPALTASRMRSAWSPPRPGTKPMAASTRPIGMRRFTPCRPRSLTWMRRWRPAGLSTALVTWRSRGRCACARGGARGRSDPRGGRARASRGARASAPRRRGLPGARQRLDDRRRLLGRQLAVGHEAQDRLELVRHRAPSGEPRRGLLDVDLAGLERAGSRAARRATVGGRGAAAGGGAGAPAAAAIGDGADRDGPRRRRTSS